MMDNCAIFFWGLLTFWIFGAQALACEAPKQMPYPSLAVDGGWAVFGEMPLPKQEKVSNPVMGLSLSFLDCSSGVSKLISSLPYLTDPGQIQDAFIEGTENGHNELFVIHSVPIRSATGMGYASDYYTVLVFVKNGSGFSSDQRLTDYFGRGADVIDPDDDADRFIYSYPYKTKDSIVAKLKSKGYERWAGGTMSEFPVINKATIYSTQSTGSATKMYLVPGDKVDVEIISAGWVLMRYMTPNKREIKGWVMCSDLDGC